MSPITAPSQNNRQLQSVLDYLPISSTKEYAKGQLIYSPDNPSRSIFLVVSGNVEISRIGCQGKEVVLEIVPTDELFGESAFLDVSDLREQATALEKTQVMTWAISELEVLVMQRPRLAMALLQVLALRNAEFTRRIESFSTESIEQRLTGALLRFSERLGKREADGSFRMMPFTHQQLSRYVGTSREVITLYMGQLRRQGYLTYSRRGIVLNRNAMKTSAN